jgi:hypothetical protein
LLQSQSLGYTAGSDQPRKKLSKAEKQRRAEACLKFSFAAGYAKGYFQTVNNLRKQEFELGRVAEEERLRRYFAELDNQPTKVEFD